MGAYLKYDSYLSTLNKWKTTCDCTIRPKAHKEENDPGSHSLSIRSQAEDEGKVEKAEAVVIGGLGGKKS